MESSKNKTLLETQKVLREQLRSAKADEKEYLGIIERYQKIVSDATSELARIKEPKDAHGLPSREGFIDELEALALIAHDQDSKEMKSIAVILMTTSGSIKDEYVDELCDHMTIFINKKAPEIHESKEEAKKRI